MIKIAVAGAEGRMGRLITELVQNDPKTQLSACITRSHPVSTCLTGSNPVTASNVPDIAKSNPITSPNVPDVANTDLLIDFSHPEAVMEHAKFCLQHNIAMVIGVTGLNTQQKDTLHTLSKKIALLLSPNMSLGVNLSFKLLEMMSGFLKEKEEALDIAISEIHHHHKKDSPSGTAKRMGEIIATNLGKTLETSGIQFSSLRLGEVMGDHRALFAFEGEQLEITHKALDRIIFAKGALLAAKWLYGKPPGFYTMQDALAL